jgi:predicted membrane-bound dolichyl-phosphate-mannose-protein mannosyltransferase
MDNNRTLTILKNIYRDHETSPEVVINFERKSIKSIFCINCGNYLIKNPKSRNIYCFCDNRKTFFLIYKNFIETFSDYYSGDEIDDYIESHEGAHPALVKYIFNLILFGEIYKKPFFNQVDDFITHKILSFIVT